MEKVKKICANPKCGKEFEILKGEKKNYCSPPCGRTFHLRKSPAREEKLCAYCGTPFLGIPSSKFCKSSHKISYFRYGPKKGRSITKCVYCKEEFLGKPGQSFCCLKHKERYHIEKRIPVPKTVRSCNFCGTYFTASGNKKFCCSEHREQYFLKKGREERKAANVPRNCTFCGNEFQTAKNFKGNVFCCDEHKSKYHSMRRLGDKTIFTEEGPLLGKEVKRICHYCTTEYRSNVKRKFCCDAHRLKFEAAVRAKRPIMVRVNNKLVIPTTKYNSILDILKNYRGHTEDLSSYTSRKIDF